MMAPKGALHAGHKKGKTGVGWEELPAICEQVFCEADKCHGCEDVGELLQVCTTREQRFRHGWNGRR